MTTRCDAAADPMTAGDALGRRSGQLNIRPSTTCGSRAATWSRAYCISKPLPADEFADWLAARVPLLGQA